MKKICLFLFSLIFFSAVVCDPKGKAQGEGDPSGKSKKTSVATHFDSKKKSSLKKTSKRAPKKAAVSRKTPKSSRRRSPKASKKTPVVSKRVSVRQKNVRIRVPVRQKRQKNVRIVVAKSSVSGRKKSASRKIKTGTKSFATKSQQLSQVKKSRMGRTPKQKRTQGVALANLNQFARKQIIAQPGLATKIQQTQNQWYRDKTIQTRWHNDWNRYASYHYNRNFNVDTFIHSVYFAPWYVFPSTFYSDFYGRYPIYRVHRGWFNYPIYWDYGYAGEISLARYIERKRFNEAIDRLDRRLDELENDVSEMETGYFDEEAARDIKVEISEIIWLFNDLKRIIIDQARLSQSQQNRLLRKIDVLKERGHSFMNSIG